MINPFSLQHLSEWYEKVHRVCIKYGQWCYAGAAIIYITRRGLPRLQPGGENAISLASVYSFTV